MVHEPPKWAKKKVEDRVRRQLLKNAEEYIASMNEKHRGRRRPRFDPILLSHEHAETLARRIAFLSVDMVMKLEHHDVDHWLVENNIMTIWGYLCRLRRMRYALMRLKIIERLEAERLKHTEAYKTLITRKGQV